MHTLHAVGLLARMALAQRVKMKKAMRVCGETRFNVGSDENEDQLCHLLAVIGPEQDPTK